MNHSACTLFLLFVKFSLFSEGERAFSTFVKVLETGSFREAFENEEIFVVHKKIGS